MTPPPPSPPSPLNSTAATQWALTILAGTACLALLYLGRPILVPITLAVVLSFALAPPVRALRRVGLGHVASVLVTVSTAGIFVAVSRSSSGRRWCKWHPACRSTKRPSITS